MVTTLREPATSITLAVENPMSVARELFLDVGHPRLSAGDEAYEKLSRAAELWRKDGQHFSAGLAMLDACDAAWGQPDRMLEALEKGLTDFERAVAEEPPSSPVSIAALYKLRQSVNRTSWFDDDRSTASTSVRELSSELGQRLLKHFKDSEHADSYLIRGVVLITDRDGMWDTRFPDYEVPSSIEHPGREKLILNIPSAFRLFVSNGEWQAAHEIVNLRRDAFTTPGLRGWRAVTAAHAIPAEAVTRFDEAADAFETDAMPSNEDLLQRGGHWSGVNQQLWAKFFRARARLVESIRTPEKVEELLDQAVSALSDTGWHSGEVSRFHVLTKVLSKLVSNPLSLNAEEARREYELEIRMSGESEEDRLALRFISEAADGFHGFVTDPRREMTRNRLDNALTALAKIPIMGPEIAEAVRPEIGEKAFHIGSLHISALSHS